MSRFPLAILFLYGAARVLTGGWHMLAVDGGANTIAGINLSLDGPTIVSLFAWAGATQFAIGLLAILTVLLNKQGVFLFLWAAALEQFLIVLNAWILKPVIQVTGAVMPPATYIGIAACILLTIAALSARRSNQQTK